MLFRIEILENRRYALNKNKHSQCVWKKYTEFWRIEEQSYLNFYVFYIIKLIHKNFIESISNTQTEKSTFNN